MQGLHTLPRGDTGVWALSAQRSSSLWSKTHSWSFGPHTLHPAMPPNYLECNDSWQLLGTLPGPAWAVIVMPQGDALQCQTMSECFCFPCKASPLQPVEYFYVFLRLLFQLFLSLFHNSLCVFHQLLFNPTDSWFPFNIC